MSRPKKRAKGMQRHGICVYCGKEGPITSDHIFPRVIFETLDEQMLTVPSCGDCQTVKSFGDRDLRTLIVVDVGGSTHPEAMALARKMLKDSNVRLRNWLRKEMENSEDVELVTDTGIYVGKAMSIKFNMDRVIESQKMVARGLYFHERKCILEPGAAVDTQYVPWHLAPGVDQRLSAAAPMAIREKGNKVAAWSFHQVDGLGTDSVVIHIIYNNWVYFLASTGDAAEWAQQRRDADHGEDNELTSIAEKRPRRIVVPRDPQGRPLIPPQ